MPWIRREGYSHGARQEALKSVIIGIFLTVAVLVFYMASGDAIERYLVQRDKMLDQKHREMMIQRQQEKEFKRKFDEDLDVKGDTFTMPVGYE